MPPSARFDDLVAGRSFRMAGPIAEMRSDRLSEVRAALAAAERSAADGAWVAAMIAYEAAPAFDPALRVRPGDPGVPLAWFGVFADCEPIAPPPPADPAPADWVPSIGAAAHRAAVEAIRAAIADGVAYQVNLSHRLRASGVDPARLYAAALAAQRPAFGALLEFGGRAVVSVSPELLFEFDDGRLATRPMKGTARRGRWAAEDRERAAALAASPKDRAENLMIVDLLRNDLGRVARFGSVAVDALFEVEAYETVWQMTSTVTAEARPGAGVAEVLAALFPCGSVTGAPKSSAMAVIADLEDSPRGAYCGTIGFIEPGARRAVFSVAIRTAVVDLETGAAVYGTGGGITWDSAADAEWDEAAAKAAVLTSARPPFDLLETLRIDGRGIHELDRHLDRLAGSAAYFRRPLDPGVVRAALAAVPDGDPPRRIRLTVDAAGRPSVQVAPIPSEAAPVRLAVDPEPVDRHDVFRYHKTTRRHPYERAAARFPDADDVVAVNDAGEVVETTVGNLTVFLDGRWLTPPVDSGCLPGVERARLLEAGEASEAVVRVEDLHRADEIRVVNSVRLQRAAVLV